MRKVVSLFLAIVFASITFLTGFAESGSNSAADYDLQKLNLEIDSKSAILMEAETGKILYSKNEKEGLPPASVTKIMTLLLICEALEN